jgi:hypothetical protein
MFPVELAYLAAPAPDYVRAAAETCCEINAKVNSGQVVDEARS